MLSTRFSTLFSLMILFFLIIFMMFTTACSDSLERSLAAPPSEEDNGAKDTEPLREEKSVDAVASGSDGAESVPAEEPETGDSILISGERQDEEDETSRRETLGSFYVPLPAERMDNPPVKARGIYLTGHSIGLTSRYDEILKMVETSELNSLVIDVKNDHGLMSYPSQVSIVNEVGADRRVPVEDMAAVLAELKEKGIYTIGRVVIFKDPYLAEKKPEWAIQRQDGGGIWREKGVAWVDPYEKNVWDYNIAIAREAALLGFREIQLDYVRFPENAARLDREAYYPAQDEREKDELIRDFVIYAGQELEPYNVYLSADVFGVIATSWGDGDRIGQTWEMLSPYVDYICPMVYPSHYGPGYFGFPVPDARPGETVDRALRDSLKRNAPLDNPAIIRPWLQNFTASWIRGNISYGPREIRAQIEAAYNLGIDEYLLWNARNRYQPDSLIPEAASDARFQELAREREAGGLDALGRTADAAVESYLEAIRQGNWREAYALQGNTEGRDFQTYPDWKDKWTLRPAGFHVDLAHTDPDHDNRKTTLVDLEMKGGQTGFKLYRDKWQVEMANTLWRVIPSPAFLELLEYDGNRLSHWPVSY